MFSINTLLSIITPLFYYKLQKKLIIKGSKLLNISYLSIIIISWIGIIAWVVFNGGLYSSIESKESTTNMKIKEPILTNFTSEDFDTNYVKPEEFINYNRVWDSEDYSIVFPEEIQIITNLIITANQTQSNCPESPLIIGALCDPNVNHCKKGRKIKHGIETGRCVQGDFKYQNDTTKQWMYSYDCEILGWCPVERFLPPLKGFAPVLGESEDTTLWLKNTIRFDKYDIVLDNQYNPDIAYYLKCRYDPKKDPFCPIFYLKDIVENSQNNKQSYQRMARFGAIININILWKCYKPVFRSFSQTNDCRIEYSFVRIDNETTLPTTGYTSVRLTFPSLDGRRTHWRAYALRLSVYSRAKLVYFDYYQFITDIFAYSNAFHSILFIFSLIVRQYLNYHQEQLDDVLDLSNKNQIETQESDESLPLIQSEETNSKHSINSNENSREPRSSNGYDSLRTRHPLDAIDS